MFITDLPELALLAGTRGALGVGVGLLLSDQLREEQRQNIGWSLMAIGVLTAVPLTAMLFGRRARSDADSETLWCPAGVFDMLGS